MTIAKTNTGYKWNICLYDEVYLASPCFLNNKKWHCASSFIKLWTEIEIHPTNKLHLCQ